MLTKNDAVFKVSPLTENGSEEALGFSHNSIFQSTKNETPRTCTALCFAPLSVKVSTKIVEHFIHCKEIKCQTLEFIKIEFEIDV